MRGTGFKYTGKVRGLGNGNETQVDTMRAGPAITQEEPIRNRADNHRETDDTRTSKQDTNSRS